MLRWPSARGPNSERAIHPADDPPGGEIVRDPFDQRRVVQFLDRPVVLARRLRQLPAVDRRPPERMIGHVAIGIAEDECDRHRAPRPSAQPASPGAGGTKRRSKPDSARIRALATPFSATPPPRHRSGRPVSRCSARAMSTSMSSSTALDAGGDVGEAPAVRGLQIDRLVRVARRPEQLDESRRIRPLGRRVELEIVEVEREGAVGRAADHLAHRVGHASAGRRRRGPSPCTRPRSPRSRERR